MNNNYNKFVDHLAQEIVWVEELNSLLAEERGLLITSQFELLDQIVAQKQQLSDKLEHSAKERVALVQEHNSESISLGEFLKSCTQEEAQTLNQLNQTLVKQLDVCRELNTVNGQVIVNNIHSRQALINTLSGNHADPVSVYTASGSLEGAADTLHHQEA